jgi:rhodanese-related sulfurtransferase
MKKYLLAVIIIFLGIFVLSGCTTEADNPLQGSTNDNNNHVPKPDPTSTAAVLTKITAEQAKEMIDSSTELVVLDVRTQEEYEEGHIEGAILIPDDEIATKAEELLTDKNATLLVYCRSGRRSALASQLLNELGYTSVYDFGGILDWPYEVVTN